MKNQVTSDMSSQPFACHTRDLPQADTNGGYPAMKRRETPPLLFRIPVQRSVSPHLTGITPKANSQSGNIFFWIFIMIVLFGALSWAMSQGSRSSGSTVSSEKAKLAAADIVDYGRMVRDAVKKMRINDIPLNNIDFVMVNGKRQNETSVSFKNTNCSTPSCEVFNLSGGAVNERSFYEYANIPPGYVSTWFKGGQIHPVLIKVNGIGSSASELALRILAIDNNVCKEINKSQGLSWPIYESYTGEVLYDYVGLGTTINTNLAQTDNYYFGQDVPALVGKNIFCMGAYPNVTEVYMVLEGR